MNALQVQHKKSPLSEDQLDALESVMARLTALGVSRRAIARRGEFHPSYISHLMNGTGSDDIGVHITQRIVRAVRVVALEKKVGFPDGKFERFL